MLATFHIAPAERDEGGDRFDEQLRSVRNQTIHGGSPAEELVAFLDELMLVQPIVRAAYVLALGDDRGGAARTSIGGRVSDQPTRVPRTLLGAAYRGSPAADEAPAALELHAAMTM